MGLGGSVDRDFNKCGKTGKGVPGEKYYGFIDSFYTFSKRKNR